MLIETEILYTDESKSNIMGRDVNETAPFIFDLSDVSGIMPGDSGNKSSIIFLHGRDLLINLAFNPLIKQYKKVKKSDVHFSPQEHEG